MMNSSNNSNSNSTAFMDHLRQLFAECDLDGSGWLGRDEFKELCSKIGLSDEVAEETFERLDIDKNSQITFDEFAAGFARSKQGVGGGVGGGGGGVKSISQKQLAANQQSQKVSAAPAASSPVSRRAQSRGTPAGQQIGSTAPSPVFAPLAGQMISAGGSSGNLTGRSSLSQYESSSYDMSQNSCDGSASNPLPPLQQSLSACDLTHNSPAANDMIVYSSDQLAGSGGGGGGGDGACSSGQFGSLLSSSSTSYSQFKTMQDLLESVQKLQSENQILSQIFFKDKREREEYISQLGEEFDQQLREVEERANKRAREELEAEKKRLREMMQTERETLQQHYQTLEKMSKLVNKSGASSNGANSAGGEDFDSGLYKVKNQLEDTFQENRQLKKSLLDTKTDVALIWKEMEKIKKQYELKLSSAYEKQRETQTECDHIKRQLNLMKDSNQKLQDASDVITSYITDKVEPVIKVALDGGGGGADDGGGGGPSLNGCRLASSASNSRRGSILSEYLNNNNDDDTDDDNDHQDDDNGDLESMASSNGGDLKKTTAHKIIGKISQTSDSANFLDVPSGGQRNQQQSANKSLKADNKPPNNKETPVKSSEPKEIAQTTSSARQSLKNIGRHFLLGSANRTQSTSSDVVTTTTTTTAKASLDVAEATKTKTELSKSMSADHSAAAAAAAVNEGPNVEPADGPSVATFNVILVGDSFVGKSSFAARFIEGSFVQGLISNCSIDFKTKSYKVDGVNYTVNLWDTAGQERFRSITASYFRKADGIVLMYDVTDKRSYLNVRNWMSTIADTAAENVAVLLVGNKIDLRQNDNKAKCVPTEEGFRLAREYDIVFLETSVKTGTNLLPSMGKLIRLIAKNNTVEDEDTDRIRLSDKGRTFNCMPKNC